MHATELVIVIAVVSAAVAWIASLVSGDTSWIDRLWSILPESYVWVYAASAQWRNAPLDAAAVLTTLWGVRLTYNLARKGGYAGHEDYRWAVLRSSMNAWRFQLFNLFFIVIYQSLLLVLIALPARTIAEHPTTSFGPLDAALSVLFLAALIGETIADQQQWRFQQWKRREVAAGRSPEPRFLQTGLFRYARHPNYFFEIAQWWLVFLFGAVAAGSLAQPTVLGAVLLSALFVGSTSFTERITRSRYPEYVRYQAATSAIVPWFAGSRELVMPYPPDPASQAGPALS